ncbi:MAG TPA: gephyrin-like molybdotransferase Glp [Stenomitos sp.]
MIPVEQALQTILTTVSTLPPEPVDLYQALGRVLAEPVTAHEHLPPFDNSAMDGFAVRVADVQAATADQPVELPIASEVAAGERADVALASGQAIRIMTGAPTPPGAEAVIRVEDTEVVGDRVRLKVSAPLGDNIRRAGEDVAAGTEVLAAGMVLTPARLQMAAAVGRPVLSAIRPVRVGILATGDELVDLADPLLPGQIRNSNAYGLYAQVLAAGAIPVPLGVAKDTRADTEAKLRAGLAAADVVVSSGGVSMGEYDFVSEVLAELGTVHFTAIAQQPGKPLTYATVAGKPFFGLPGNPVSTMVSFELYVRPALRKMMGHAALFRPEVEAELAGPLKSPAGKRSFLRAVVTRSGDRWIAALTGPQGSGMIHSMVNANALLVIPEQTRRMEAGERVKALLIEQPEEDRGGV